MHFASAHPRFSLTPPGVMCDRRIPYRVLLDFSHSLPVGLNFNSSSGSPVCDDIVSDPTCIALEDVCYFTQGRPLKFITDLHPFQIEDLRKVFAKELDATCQGNLGISCSDFLPAAEELIANASSPTVGFNCDLITSWFIDSIGEMFPYAFNFATLSPCDASQVGGGTSCFALADVCKYSQGVLADYMDPATLVDKSFYDKADPRPINEQFQAWLTVQTNNVCQFLIGQQCIGHSGLFQRRIELPLSDFGIEKPLFAVDCSKMRLYTEVVRNTRSCSGSARRRDCWQVCTRAYNAHAWCQLK